MTAPKTATLSRTERLYIAVLVFGSTVTILLVLALIVRSYRVPSDYQYTLDRVNPPKPAYCPGEAFQITYDIKINKVPTVIMVVQTFYSETDNGTGGTVVFDAQPVYTVHTHAQRVRRTITVRVPPLPPGRYQFRQGAQAFDSPASAFAVPFVVPPGCH